VIVRGERLLLVVTPAVAMAAVALGLRVGAGQAVRAAIAYGAPTSGGGIGLAWQVATFEEDHGVREPVAVPEVEVTARSAGGDDARWRGSTNEDGTAEVLLAVPTTPVVALEVRAGSLVLARGEVGAPSSSARPPPATTWARFAQRQGSIALDVAVLGQRVASGFPATIWVRATDATTRAPVVGATVEPERDPSLSASTPAAPTDSRGWARVEATPVGHAVALMLHARTAEGRTGDWAGALLVSPGAAQLALRDRYTPDEWPVLDVVVPNVRTTEYVEIDDALGRAWAATVALTGSDTAMPRARIQVPRLARGLYWAVASSDPAGAAQLGPGTIVRPFFVATTDESALALGTDDEACTPPRDGRETSRVIAVCLALACATAVPRWTALDGFSAQHARDAQQRAYGLAVALGAIAVAMLLETVLLLRVARAARMRLRVAMHGAGDAGDTRGERARKVGIALLVALLGFALLAAFLVRAG
jgi:hypothetical protein